MSGDSEPPVLVMDNTAPNCTTGGELTFSANFTDNVSVVAAYVNYTSGGTFFNNFSMDNVVGEMWNKTITVEITAVQINYTFYFKDGANNTNTTETKTITIIDTIPPVANAGDDISVKDYETFHLNGTGSFDNIHIANYTWYWICEDCGEELHYYGVRPLVYPVQESLTFILNVTDAAGNLATDIVNIILLDSDPPSAVAGDDIGLRQYETAYFDGSGSWDNVDIVNYTWSFFYDGSLIRLYGVYANFTFDLVGDYTVTLDVVDAEANKEPHSTDSMLVTVFEVVAPVAVAGEDIEVGQYATVVFDGGGSHDNTGIVSYEWNFTYDGQMQYLHDISPEFSFITVGRYLVTLNVSDRGGSWAVDSMNVTVRDATDPVAEAGPNMEISWGMPVIFNASGSTDNIGIVNYTWSFSYNGTFTGLYGMKVTFYFYVVWMIIVRLTATDAEGNKGIDTCFVKVIDDIPPEVNAGLDLVADEGTLVTLDATGTKDHSDILNYTWSFAYGGKQQNLSGAKTGFLFDVSGTYTIFVFVTDIWGNEGWDYVIVKIRDLTPPVASAGENLTIRTGEEVTFLGSGTDNEAIRNYTWRFIYDNSEQLLYGRTVEFVFDIPGNYSVCLTVRDNMGNTGQDTTWVNVTPTPEEEKNGTDDDTVGDDIAPTDSDGEDEERKRFISSEEMYPIIILLIIIIIALVAGIWKKTGKRKAPCKVEVEAGKEPAAVDLTGEFPSLSVQMQQNGEEKYLEGSCTNCGAKVRSVQNFCTVCGSKVEDEHEEVILDSAESVPTGPAIPRTLSQARTSTFYRGSRLRQYEEDTVVELGEKEKEGEEVEEGMVEEKKETYEEMGDEGNDMRDLPEMLPFEEDDID